MTHPLTDEMIEEIAQFEPDLTDPLRLNRDNDMRAAYDLAIEHVIEWMEQYLTAGDVIAEDLKKAMRPNDYR